MADPYWWLNKQPVAKQRDAMEDYDPFGVRRLRPGAEDPASARDRRKEDPRERYDPRNAVPATITPRAAPEESAATSGPPVAAQRGLLDMIAGALANPANPGATQGQSGYGPIPGGGPSPNTLGRGLGLAGAGMDIYAGRPIRGPMGIGVNPYYGGYYGR